MQRTQEIDIFRGLNILEMENTESCDHPFFDHAEYDHMKMNYADTIFPCFSFISGMLLKEQRIVPFRKSLQLIGLGMAFNAIPTFIEGEKFRPLGVLQRHGLSSIILNNIVSTENRNSVSFPIALTCLWYLISIGFSNNRFNPFKIQKDTAQQKIDSPFFKGRTYHENFDPEGLLGALMTSVTIWSGSWFMRNSGNFSNIETFLLGSGLLSSGLVLSKISPEYMPISKPLWSPTFVLTSNGISILKYLMLKVTIPYFPTVLKNLLSIVGKHSMEVYFLGEIVLLGLKYCPKNGSSLWNRMESLLNKVLPKGITQGILTVGFDISLVCFAFLCHSKGWRIRLL
ncbi:hypothetical protein C6P40_002574 [Pichia californica]|uniref:Heparan-alpha-glucosaminide N-acetyltransferase catalytic domain-containing protein n=1 Tax=Pichia californica TaxID=460514 RepID=A0A9P7BEN8_9ASCO|nr:hypothetical protein C6P40_002574 [[Candida] californica]